MENKKTVLIIENCTSGLRPIKENVSPDIDPKEKKYILSGTFTEFNVKNRNERIYTAEKFLPHLNDLLERKNQTGVLYGEYDHPEVFDTALARVSHTVEKLVYNQNENKIDGEIRLLNNHWGKEARALVDDNCPIFVSSRAAGITESDGTVTIKKLFTYDCVADPGFASAKMTLKSLNESLGFNENTNFRIYDMSQEEKFNQLLMDNNNKEFITKQQLTEYSAYLTEQIESISKLVQDSVKAGKTAPEEVVSMFETLEGLKNQHSRVTEYLDYLAETIQVLVEQNNELRSTTTKLIEHSDYLADNLEKSINYSNYLAEKLDKNINYSEYIAETLDNNIEFSQYIAENVNKNIQYSEYLAENIEKSIDYSEYIAEHLDKNIAYAEYIAEHVDKNIAYSEYIAEHVEKSIEYAEYLAEHVDNNILYAEYIAENVSDTQAYNNYLAESLDKTIDIIKGQKLNENTEIPEFKVDDINAYYEDDDKPKDVQGPQTETSAVAPETNPDVEVKGDIDAAGDEVALDVKVDAQPDAEAVKPAETEVEIETDVQPDADDKPAAIEGDVQPEILTPAATLAAGDLVTVKTDDGNEVTADVKAISPETGFAVVQITTPEGVEEVEVHESKITKIAGSFTGEDTLKKQIGGLIAEAKKRKAEANKQPHFIQFLSEKNKKAFYSLSAEDQDKIKVALNESIYMSESAVLEQINKVLSPDKTFEQILIENMPNDLIPVFEKLSDGIKTSLLAQAKLYPNLDSSAKIEAFWHSRKLEQYSIVKETKQVLASNDVIDNSQLSENQLQAILERFKTL